MAVDSRQKRMSMMSFGQPILFVPMFEADGQADADDRAHMLNLYSGFRDTEDTPPAAGVNHPYLLLQGVG